MDTRNMARKKTTTRKGRRKRMEQTTVGRPSSTRGFLHPLVELPSVSKNVTFLSAEFARFEVSDDVLMAGFVGCGTGRL